MIATQPAAITLIDKLIDSRSALSVDWEGILAKQYTALLRNPRVVVDVGAHRGTHTFHFLNIGAGRVVCFEPIPDLAYDLSLALASYPAAELHNLALSDSEGVSHFVHNISAPGESGLEERVASALGEGERKIITVTVKTLDSFNLKDVDFIKIDCEGAELRILKGSKDTVMQNRPYISIEYGHGGYSVYGAEKSDLWRWALDTGYVVTDLFGNLFSEWAVYDYCVDKFYWDFFLIPREKIDRASDLLLQQHAFSLLPEEK